MKNLAQPHKEIVLVLLTTTYTKYPRKIFCLCFLYYVVVAIQYNTGQSPPSSPMARVVAYGGLIGLMGSGFGSTSIG